MTDFLDLAENTFKQHKWRFTAGARNLAKVLNQTETPLPVKSIRQEIINKGLTIDTATVYRLLDRFIESKLIHRVLDGYMICTDPENTEESHHFLLCDECGKADEIFLNYHDAIAKQLKKEKDFSLGAVEMVFKGKCKKCAPEAKTIPKRRLFNL